MSSYINKWSLTATWLLMLAVALSMAAGTIPPVAWVTLALIGLMPPAMLIALSNVQQPATADVMRVGAGRSL